MSQDQGPPSGSDGTDDEAAWAVATAETLRARGELTEAAAWYRRAANHLLDAGEEDRALELAKLAAEMAALGSADRSARRKAMTDAKATEVKITEARKSEPPPPKSKRTPTGEHPTKARVDKGEKGKADSTSKRQALRATPDPVAPGVPKPRTASMVPPAPKPVAPATAPAATKSVAPAMPASTVSASKSVAPAAPVPTAATKSMAPPPAAPVATKSMAPPPAPTSSASKSIAAPPMPALTRSVAPPAVPAPKSMLPLPTQSPAAPRSSFPLPSSSRSVAPPPAAPIASTAPTAPAAPTAPTAPAAPAAPVSRPTPSMSPPAPAPRAAPVVRAAPGRVPALEPAIEPARLLLAPERAADVDALVTALASTPLLAELPADRVREVARQLTRVRVASGDVLTPVGALDAPLWLVLDGAARVELPGDDAPASSVGGGELALALTALCGGENPATVRAQEALDVVALAPSLARALAREFPAFRAALEASARDQARDLLPRVMRPLARLEPPARDKVSAACELRVLPEGSLLFAEGEPVRALSVLVAGTVELTGPAFGERRVHRARVGDVMGVASWVSSRASGATARTGSTAVVARMPVAVAQRLVREIPAFGEALGTASALGPGVLC